MSVFYFKKFQVNQSKSAMKIGTDSVLLGCFCETNAAKNILDIGTGTGLLSLMLAQKSDAMIDAVEIDFPAFSEAKLNIESSKWKNRMHVYHLKIQAFQTDKKYDIIISNPPFYQSKKNYSITDISRSKARHDESLSFDDLMKHVDRLLDEDGTFWLVLPANEAIEWKQIMTDANWYLVKNIIVHPKPEKAPNRFIMCWSRKQVETIDENFYIYNASGEYSNAYKFLTKDFLLWKDKNG